MASEFSREFFSANRIVKADLHCARQPREQDLDKIKAELKSLYDATEVLLDVSVDESLLSGYVLQVGDRVFDNSGRHALDQMTGDKPDLATLKTRVEDYKPAANTAEGGTVVSAADGIVTVEGMDRAVYGEIVTFENGAKGMVESVEPSHLGIMLFDGAESVGVGTLVTRTGKRAGIPVGEAFLGRVRHAGGGRYRQVPGQIRLPGAAVPALPRDGVRYPARRTGQGNRPAGTAGPSGPGRCGLRCRGRRSQRCRNAGAGRAFLLHGGRHENRQSCRQGAGPCRCTRWHCPAVPQSVAGDIPLNTKQPYTHVGPGLPPLYGAQAKALILGSFPSPKSRTQGFYYGHPQNRFWPLMATLTHSPTPAWEDLDAKRAIIIGSGLAVWDVIHACSIRGASDASIKDVEPNDLAALVNRLGVQAIFCNGATSGRLYRKYAQPLTGLEAVVLPSTSPANAAFTMPRLLDAWGTALEGYVNKP